ncbi:hypothetical protein ElyMa_001628800 [Elysia marginata]|uniref:Uncharacterized protein n=1 Tax=Elysia marginata TaxID=1093978 RepID=A0AAV4JM56_9GAST|nr:hypothetical protein ElyMa_001628800 [Elysia marginata]
MAAVLCSTKLKIFLKFLPRIKSDQKQQEIRSLIDLTVRLRVNCTSLDRPDDDEIAGHRGTDRLRVGTGCIRKFGNPEYNKPCPCGECRGAVTRKHWRFHVRTARHVVFNTEEAKKTSIDLFYDDEHCKENKTMRSMRGVDLLRVKPGRDWCEILCVTCDEDLGERIESAGRCWLHNDKIKPGDLYDLRLLPSSHKDCDPVMIVSHPHGQPKKITMGELRCRDEESPRIEYSTPTCPGTSGAPVFVSSKYLDKFSYVWWSSPVHSGSYGDRCAKRNIIKNLIHKLRGCKTTPEQLNYGYDELWSRLDDDDI